MSLHRRAARRDKAEKPIVDTLRKLGWSVEHLSIADGPDLLLGKAGETHLAEVKSGKHKVKPGQAEWHRLWRGATVVILRTPEDAIRFAHGHARLTDFPT